MALEYAIPFDFVYPENATRRWKDSNIRGQSTALLGGNSATLLNENCVALKGLHKSDEQRIHIVIAPRVLMRVWVANSQEENSDLIPGLGAIPISIQS